jgi:hypothetical protein
MYLTLNFPNTQPIALPAIQWNPYPFALNMHHTLEAPLYVPESIPIQVLMADGSAFSVPNNPLDFVAFIVWLDFQSCD